MKRMFFCALLSTTIWAGVLESNYTKEKFEKIDNRTGEEIAKKYVEETIKKTPLKINSWTTLTNATSINTKIYFVKTIDKNKNKDLKEMLSKEQGKKAYIKTIYETRKKEMCKNNEDKAYMYEKNIGIQDDYYEKNTNEYIGGFSIDKSDCVEMEKQQQKRGKNPLL